MVIPTEVIYDEDTFINRPTLGLRTWKAVTSGTITEMRLWVENAGGPGSARGYFNVRKNGVPLFTNPDRPQVTNAVFNVTKTGLSIPVSLGDELSLGLERAQRIVIYSPITFLMLTEE
jgi:hypothetical protein